MRYALFAILALGCGKELNPEFCDAHSADDRCLGGTTGIDAVDNRDAVSDTTMRACPASYDQTYSASTSRYRLVDTADDWLSAAQICAVDGATTHLAVLSTDVEWMALTNGLDAAARWVGHSDRITADTYLAVTDEPNVYPALVMGTQPPWGSGGTTGDCAIITRPNVSGLLYPRSCDNEDVVFICECDAYANDASNY